MFYFSDFSTGATPYPKSTFGPGTGPIFLDNVGCSGTESSLLNCSHAGIGNHNCVHSEDAGVRCQSKEECLLLPLN